MPKDSLAKATAEFHPHDPRRLAREALEQDAVPAAQVWAELATAEAIHRLAKVVARTSDVADHGRVTQLHPVDGPESAA